ncbi:hypothetical protein GCM10010297_00740 [Streptomyces malachitofuscus]|nr:hypothetical protein GCM10010297_00740 [Streptomyces malachitofuscus]
MHGDLKPANVLLMADGSVRLADFNTAAELEGAHAYAVRSRFRGGTTEARADAAMRYARGAEELRLSAGLPEDWREIVPNCLASPG